MSSEGGNDPKVPELATRQLERERWTSSLAARPPLVGDRDVLLVRRFTLLVVTGAGAGNRVVSAGERLTISSPAADLVVADAAVAPYHCEVALAGKLVVLRNLDSGRGTSVNGVTVRVAHLRGGSVITVGGTELRFDTGGDPVALPLSPGKSFGGLVGASRPMRRLFAQLERAAAGDDAVLLEGEPGTGKRTAALALHRHGARKGGPFVTVAGDAAREGEAHLAAAAGGTLLIHEVGGMSLDQRQLLGAIDGRARLVATTTRNLRAAVNAGRFDPALLRRLAQVELRAPPLREREDNLALLVGHFTTAFDAGAAGERLRSREQLVELARRSFPRMSASSRCSSRGRSCSSSSAARPRRRCRGRSSPWPGPAGSVNSMHTSTGCWAPPYLRQWLGNLSDRALEFVRREPKFHVEERHGMESKLDVEPTGEGRRGRGQLELREEHDRATYHLDGKAMENGGPRAAPRRRHMAARHLRVARHPGGLAGAAHQSRRARRGRVPSGATRPRCRCRRRPWCAVRNTPAPATRRGGVNVAPA